MAPSTPLFAPTFAPSNVPTPTRAAQTPQPELALNLIAELTRRELTLAVAESLTGGLLGAALTEIPGSSRCVRGGIIAYATDLKSGLLGVDLTVLEHYGPVHSDVAREMALGVARQCGATFGLSTTGVAGPSPQNGIDVGTVFVSLYDQRDASYRTLSLKFGGDRNEVRRGTVEQALTLAYGVAVLNPE